MVKGPRQGVGDGGVFVVADGLGESVGQRSSGGHGSQVDEGNQGGLNNVTKALVEDCREDRGYGDWILVDRRKPHKLKFQQAPVARAFRGGSGGAVKFRKEGYVVECGMKFEAVKVGGGSVAREGVKKGEIKPLFVFSRRGGNSKAAGGNFRKKGGGVGGGRKVAVGSDSVGGKVGGAEVFASRKEANGSILLEGEGGSLLLEDEGGRKRRRGEERGFSVGDASPKVT